MKSSQVQMQFLCNTSQKTLEWCSTKGCQYPATICGDQRCSCQKMHSKCRSRVEHLSFMKDFNQKAESYDVFWKQIISWINTTISDLNDKKKQLEEMCQKRQKVYLGKQKQFNDNIKNYEKDKITFTSNLIIELAESIRLEPIINRNKILPDISKGFQKLNSNIKEILSNIDQLKIPQETKENIQNKNIEIARQRSPSKSMVNSQISKRLDESINLDASKNDDQKKQQNQETQVTKNLYEEAQCINNQQILVLNPPSQNQIHPVQLLSRPTHKLRFSKEYSSPNVRQVDQNNQNKIRIEFNGKKPINSFVTFGPSLEEVEGKQSFRFDFQSQNNYLYFGVCHPKIVKKNMFTMNKTTKDMGAHLMLIDGMQLKRRSGVSEKFDLKSDALEKSMCIEYNQLGRKLTFLWFANGESFSTTIQIQKLEEDPIHLCAVLMESNDSLTLNMNCEDHPALIE